jgi:hypothetical protein
VAAQAVGQGQESTAVHSHEAPALAAQKELAKTKHHVLVDWQRSIDVESLSAGASLGAPNGYSVASQPGWRADHTSIE